MKEIDLKPIVELMNRVCDTNLDIENFKDWVLKLNEDGEIVIEKK